MATIYYVASQNQLLVSKLIILQRFLKGYIAILGFPVSVS